ncbi:hypothetical protein MVES1_000990 [Malassezia vespertilionis]|uniref:uncharacterized protein n=1 Tax=Malassezia vespertilionis TaxID=2020962 RepID=UPI0024B0B72E|nr:uncharacterized protein MVES1_000990 [Malassezia vespertilionis]WFD05658.1 hypothetical protein MVES1_000990 [Malassezia vespertilionis]
MGIAGLLPLLKDIQVRKEGRREENRAKGIALHKQNKGAAAREAFVRCADVTPQMAYELIKLLRREKVAYVVAPYEADAQLAYLESQGIIDGIITEDSDFLVFGCKTILFKLDSYGSCIEIQQARLAETKQVCLQGWGPAEFRRMAILSGCDYLPSIAGMGLKNAHRLLRKYESVDKMLRALRLEGKMRIPNTYEHDFARAEFTFVHQRVWDPRGNGCMTTLFPLPADACEAHMPFIGAPIPWETARKIACGDICPVKHTPLDGTAASTAVHNGQPSIRNFFSRKETVSCSTPRQITPRRPLAERDINLPKHTPHTTSKFFATSPACETPLFDRAAQSNEVYTPATSPLLSGCSSPPASPCGQDGTVSSPVSSPTASPSRCRKHIPAPCGPRISTPLQRPSVGLALQRHSTDPNTPTYHDDAARRSAWFKRFTFSGTRPRQTATPDTPPTPLPLPCDVLRSTPLALDAGKRKREACATPDTKKMHTNDPPSGSAKLLQFRFREKIR